MNTITISPEIVQDIARITTLATQGVIGLARKPNSWRSHENHGISVNLSNNSATIGLNVVGSTGVSLIELAANIRKNVAQAVSEVTGISVKEVDITFEDVRPY
jgi:uncharacterized alkaline shock family protein YloU